MTSWLVLAPERPDDDTLPVTAWIARQTLARASQTPDVLTGDAAVRSAFERYVAAQPNLGGVAFFGHGAGDRLFDANRPPMAAGPAVVDGENIALLRGCWVHALACDSGSSLAISAVEQGVAIYVGYCRPLDAGWEFPPSAEREFIDLVTHTTLALLSGERDERALRSGASHAADAFVLALEELPDNRRTKGWMWLHALAQQLVDDMVVRRSPVALLVFPP